MAHVGDCPSPGGPVSHQASQFEELLDGGARADATAPKPREESSADSRESSLTAEIDARPNAANRPACPPSTSRLVASAGNDGTIRLWNAASRELLSVSRHSDPVFAAVLGQELCRA
jgi:hypothetical protein